MTNPIDNPRETWVFGQYDFYGVDDKPIRIPGTGKMPPVIQWTNGISYTWDPAAKRMRFTIDAMAGSVPLGRQILTTLGSGLTGGGDLSADKSLSVVVDAASIKIIDGTVQLNPTYIALLDGIAVAPDPDSIAERGPSGSGAFTWLSTEVDGSAGFAQAGFIRLGLEDVGISWRNVVDSRDLYGMWVTVSGSTSMLRIGRDAGWEGERHDLPAEKSYQWWHGNPNSQTMNLNDIDGLNLKAGLQYMVGGAPLRQAYTGVVEASVIDDISAVADAGEILSVVYAPTKPNISLRFSFSLAGTGVSNTVFFELKVGGTAVKGCGATCLNAQYASGACDLTFTGLPVGPYTFSVDWLASSGDASILGSSLPTRQHATLTISESDA